MMLIGPNRPAGISMAKESSATLIAESSMKKIGDQAQVKRSQKKQTMGATIHVNAKEREAVIRRVFANSLIPSLLG